MITIALVYVIIGLSLLLWLRVYGGPPARLSNYVTVPLLWPLVLYTVWITR